MANPTVDKLKAFGLRHGEKVAMGVVATIFAACSYYALIHPSIQTTPDEVTKTAKLAQANLNNSPKKETIVERLEADGITLIGFEKKVEALQAGTSDASQYSLANSFVKPEPGAGLIRDMPELIAPTQIYVHAGRGAVRIIELDDDGKPKEKEAGDDGAAPRARKKAKRPAGGPMGGGMPGGGRPGSKAGSKKKNTGVLAEAQRKKDELRADEIKRKGFAGADEVKQDTEKEAEPVLLSAENYETELNGYRFVTIVGKLDHKRLKENYSKALKVDLNAANPDYKRLDVQRQELLSDGSWSAWEMVDRSVYEEVKTLLTQEEKEIVPPSAIISTLVDPLPFLEVGYWVRAHHAALIPAEMLKPKVVEAPPKNAAKGAAKGAKGNGPLGMGDYGKGAAGGMNGPGMSGRPGGGNGLGMGDYGGKGGGMKGPGMGGPNMGGLGGGPSEGAFEKSNDDWLMIRALDFSVKPDATYHYRVRIVVANPNHGWESVSPGVDTRSKELAGPWSAMTAEASVPPDVATYAVGRTPPSPNTRPDEVEFQVVRWNEDDGLTVVQKFGQAPGQIIGSKFSPWVPNEKKDRLVTKEYDFTSRQVLADALGGDRPASSIQNLGVTKFEIPVLALVVKPDGMLVVRDQALDSNNGEMAEMLDIYAQIKKEASPGNKKKSTSNMMDMYSGMGGMGAGGMGAGGMGGSRGAGSRPGGNTTGSQ
ncbi:MAG: hypothetical protein JWN86_2099 [Planctomycetota bacterium]|nr:hypothetical protein [Planctomycetota bacterium]